MQKKIGPICVVGMHRSGTSATTRFLNLGGMELGKKEDLLMEGDRGNPTGHWESNTVVAINVEILSLFGGNWIDVPDLQENWQDDDRLSELYNKARYWVDSMNKQYETWGFKDPRICITLPFWQKVIKNLRYVIVLRDPFEIALSLNKRDKFEIDTSLILWMNYWNKIIQGIDLEKSIIFAFDDLLNSTDKVISLFRNSALFNDIEWDSESYKTIKHFLKPKQKHYDFRYIDELIKNSLLINREKRLFYTNTISDFITSNKLIISSYENNLIENKIKETYKDEKIQILKEEKAMIENSKGWRIILKLRMIVSIVKQPRSLINRVITLYKKYTTIGLLKIIIKKLLRIAPPPASYFDLNKGYDRWVRTQNLRIQEIERNIGKYTLFYKPLISILVPIYNVDEQWLREMIESVRSQFYTNWELCLADDCSTQPHIRKVLEKYKAKDSRIKVKYREKNGHISAATNTALEMAKGEFVALLDNDDLLLPHALYENVKALNKDHSLDLLYSDEDKCELDGTRNFPFFKPDWSPDLLMSINYITHFAVIRTSLMNEIGGFRVGYEGSQDYDLFLRLTEHTNNIYHIPDILYTWRKIPGSTAVSLDEKSYAIDASIRSLTDALDRRGIKGSVENGIMWGGFRTKYEIERRPLISIIIPTKDKLEYLKRTVDSVISKSTYDNFEIIIVDTGSLEKKTLDFYESLQNKSKITIIEWDKEFNYSDVNNFGVKNSNGEYVLLLNNDVEVIAPDWIEAMLEHAQREGVGAVGAKLLYPNNRIQHAGVILGAGGVANHAFANFPDEVVMGPPVYKDLIRNYSAVTAACLLVSRNKFDEVDGLDPKFRIAFNDVDFCLKLSKKGYRNIYTPYAKLYHHESVSIGRLKDGTRNLIELQHENDIFMEKWRDIVEKDPQYNMNFSRTSNDFSLR